MLYVNHSIYCLHLLVGKWNIYYNGVFHFPFLLYHTIFWKIRNNLKKKAIQFPLHFFFGKGFYSVSTPLMSLLMSNLPASPSFLPFPQQKIKAFREPYPPKTLILCGLYGFLPSKSKPFMRITGIEPARSPTRT